jgi:hypothetical protein
MKLYTCDKCGNLLYFENSVCLKCGHALGFDPDKLDLVTISAISSDVFVDVTNNDAKYRRCENAIHGTCNWLVPVPADHTFCSACQLNRTIPMLTDMNLQRWKRIEVAKHRLIYSLLRLNLPIEPKLRSAFGLAFDFLGDVSPDERVMTGHDSGVITLNIEEADEAERVRNKLDLGERYRTLLGHFRHEIGHYYWDLLVKDQPAYQQFRDLFGDAETDYSEALQRYYLEGPASNWAAHFISPYATAHPWEDWAETWSHYLHMMDTLETAYYFGVNVHPEKMTGVKSLVAEVNRDPYAMRDFDQIFKDWLPLTFAVNSLNRSMGHADFYPFVVAPKAIEKIKFIHELCLQQKIKTTASLVVA